MISCEQVINCGYEQHRLRPGHFTLAHPFQRPNAAKAAKHVKQQAHAGSKRGNEDMAEQPAPPSDEQHLQHSMQAVLHAHGKLLQLLNAAPQAQECSSSKTNMSPRRMLVVLQVHCLVKQVHTPWQQQQMQQQCVSAQITNVTTTAGAICHRNMQQAVWKTVRQQQHRKQHHLQCQQ